MLVSDVLGNIDDPVWSDRLVGVRVTCCVSTSEGAQQNRLRKLAERGTEAALMEVPA